MKPLAALALAVIAVVLGGSCNFDTSFRFDARVDPGKPGTEFRDACLEQAVAFCSYVARCDELDFRREWPDAATCEERRTLGCQLEASDPSSTYDDASIRSCVLPVDLPCAGEPGYDTAVAAYRAGCNRPPGKLPDGAACVFDSACAGTYCWPYVSASHEICGACGPRPCGGGCDEDEVCWLSNLSSECVPARADGEPCTAFDECATLFCDDGVCASRPGDGDECDPNDDECDSETYCDPATERCRPYALAHANEPCGALPSGITRCIGGAKCPSLSSAETCIPPAEDGGLCDPSQSLQCLWPAVCVEGYCRFHPPPCVPFG